MKGVKNPMKHYTTREHEKAIFTAICGVIAIILAVWMSVAAMKEADRIKPDVEYPMVNQHITWEGAGYSGIYAKGGEQ